MPSANNLILRIMRGETPFFRCLKRTIRAIISPTAPILPRPVLALFRILYEAHFLMIRVWRSFSMLVYYSPMFQARCTSFGRGICVEGLPFITGPVEIHVGNAVNIGRGIMIASGRIFDAPRLVLSDRCVLRGGTTIVVNREVVIEEDVIIAPQCRISDSDGHPREADLRAAGHPPHSKDVHPVRICRFAWIGVGSYVMKGVTIGEGAIVAANSVVVSNIPPYSLAMGNPAEVFFRNYGLPSTNVPPQSRDVDA